MLYCDLTHLLPETDPYDRQIMMSHGTFLEILDVAARECGIRTNIELFLQVEFGPEEIDQRPVARIGLATNPNVVKDPLFGQILNLHTNREHRSKKRFPTIFHVLWENNKQGTQYRFTNGYLDIRRSLTILKNKQWIVSEPSGNGKILNISATKQGLSKLEMVFPDWEKAQIEATELLGQSGVNAILKAAAKPLTGD